MRIRVFIYILLHVVVVVSTHYLECHDRDHEVACHSDAGHLSHVACIFG